MRRMALIGGANLYNLRCRSHGKDGVKVIPMLKGTTNKDLLRGITVVRSPEELLSVKGVMMADSQSPQRAFVQFGNG